MEQAIVYLALVLVGAIFGSFAGASVWRLRAHQLIDDKKHNEPYDKGEYKRLEKLTKASLLNDRSQCLDCGYTLRWFDLLPIASWLALRGKCRSCRKPIGWFEPVMELSMVAFFVLSYALWPGGVQTGLQATHFILWLVAGVVLAILFAYDAKWFLLPNGATAALAVVGLGMTIVSAVETGDWAATLMAAVLSVGVMSGLYGVLYAISKGRWVGFGDVKLGVGLGLLLVDWQLAIVALFMANFIGTLIVVPLLATRKLQRSSHIPLGPLLILGTVIAFFFGWPLLDGYLTILGL